MTLLPRRAAALPLLLALVLAPAGSAYAASEPPSSSTQDLIDRGWTWPLRGSRIVAPYVAPAHAYGPGHRGIDLQPRADAEVRSPAAGVVVFSGMVAGRGILTIDHGDGLVTTLEPIASDLTPGDPVDAGEAVGGIAQGGHTPAGAIHFGVRWNGRYINPLLLLGGVPRAILLPCCD